MGKHHNRESVIRGIVNIVVHEIVVKHTNKPESSHFLESEIIEYGSQTEEAAESHNWNAEDKRYIENKAFKLIKKKLASKYPDIKYLEIELTEKLNRLVDEMI